MSNRSRHAVLQRISSASIETLEQRRLLSVSIVQGAAITSPTAQPFDQFGEVLATKGDLALLGMPSQGTAIGASTGGQVLLVDTSSGSVVRTFDNPDPQSNERFGSAVAFVGTNKIAIADIGDSVGGRVYVYDGSADVDPLVISAQNYSGTGYFPGFGVSIAGYGENLLIGSNHDPLDTNSNGMVQLYDTETGEVIRAYTNPVAGTYTLNGFGHGLAVSGNQMLVTEFLDAGVSSNGQPIVVQMNVEDGALIRTYEQPVRDDFQGFGSAMAFSGNDIFISAPAANPTNFNPQPGFVYHFDAATGSLISTINDPDPNSYNSGFGSSLALSNGTLLIGARSQESMIQTQAYDDNGDPLFDENGNPVYESVLGPAGAAFVYDAGTDTLIGEVISPATTPFEGQFNAFGSQVGFLSGDKVLFTDMFDDTGGTDAGIAWIYQLQDDSTPTNNPPMVDAIGGSTGGVAFQPLTLTGSFSDVDADDTHEVSWDFGDGRSVAFHSTGDPDALAATHRFRAPGEYTVQLSIRDSAGEVTTVSTNVSIAAAELQSGDLVVGGTRFADQITVSNAVGGLDVNINGASVGVFNPTGRIIVRGGGGDDVITVASDVTTGADLYGGNGDDSLTGGAGDDVVRGGNGNDSLLGGAGNDTIRGGNGNDIADGQAGFWDRLFGNDGDDFLRDGDGVFSANGGANNDILDLSFDGSWTKSGTSTQRRIDGRVLGDAGNDVIAVTAQAGTQGKLFFGIQGDGDVKTLQDGSDVILLFGAYRSASTVDFDGEGAAPEGYVDPNNTLYAEFGCVTTGTYSTIATKAEALTILANAEADFLTQFGQ